MTDYDILVSQLKALTQDVSYLISNLSNASALLYSELENINWAGFYIMNDGKLVLGPFQGKPACTEIAVGKGVCGTAVKEKRTVRVENVHEFPGHIACDCASNSEIVIPLFNNDGSVFGVLDIDSPLLSRFDEDDQIGLEAFVKALEDCIAK